MIQLYEIDSGRGIYWESYDSQYEHLCSIEVNELEEYLDKLYADGVDFVLHEIGGIDEYHIALPSV